MRFLNSFVGVANFTRDFWQLSPWKRNKSSRFLLKGGWLLLDNIQDPGNVGTMIRTADAAGLARRDF